MEFKDGQTVVLSDEGKRVIERRVRDRKERTKGVIRSKSRAHPDCYNIKWENRLTVELLHEKFIRPARK